MKPFKLGTAEIGGEGAAVALIGGRVFALSEMLPVPGVHSLLDLLKQWGALQVHLADAVENVSGDGYDAQGLKYLPPILDPRKLICIGVNYRDHIAEMKAPDVPAFPYAFLRPPTSLAAHGEEIRLPAMPRMIDWEAELGVVVGASAGKSNGAAAPAVAGYTIINDVSARDWIANRPWVGIDWVMQKAWDKFQPTGPWITPAQFVTDPQSLAIELTVNGAVKQKSNTSQMIFGVKAIIEHLAGILTLEPGDIIATGTPAGVGFGRNPPEFIRPGDSVRVTIEALGTLENRFI